MKINVALGKKEFGELREQGVDNGKKEEKKKENNGGNEITAEEFYKKYVKRYGFEKDGKTFNKKLKDKNIKGGMPADIKQRYLKLLAAEGKGN